MMRSLSTSAFGQPSETKLTFGARATSGFRFSICEGLPERESGSKRSSRSQRGRVDALISDALQQRRNAKQTAANEIAAQLSPRETNLHVVTVGRVAEWFKAAVLKTARGFTLPRGFESHPFRHITVAKRYNCTIVLCFEPRAPGSRP